jgi:hypothetical protein
MTSFIISICATNYKPGIKFELLTDILGETYENPGYLSKVSSVMAGFLHKKKPKFSL